VSDGTEVAQSTADFEVVEQGAAAADNSLYLIVGLLAVLVVVVVIAIAVRGKKKPPAEPAKLEQVELKW
jgi:CHASE3 domain sensor protein